MIARIPVVCLAVIVAFFATATVSSAQEDAKKAAAKLLEEIRVVADGQRISGDNSQVVIVTAAIRKIVDGGPKMIDILVLAMKDESIDFDTFTRCYSACDQILRKIDPEAHVRWYGGSRPKEVNGVTRIFRGGQMNKREFRKEVIKDIVDKAGKLKMK